MKVFGLHKDPWHNSGTSIVYKMNNKTEFVNLSEERSNRENDSRRFPILSTMACRKEAGIKNYSEFDLVVLDYLRNAVDFHKDHFKTVCLQDIFLNVEETKKYCNNECG